MNRTSGLPVRIAIRLAQLALLTLVALPAKVGAQTETIFASIGAASPTAAFAHLSLPGATGIDFDLFGAFAGAYPDTESHLVLIHFEWGPTPAGPWTSSLPSIKSVPGGTTTLFDTGVFHGPEDAPFVRLHFAAGGLMTVSGIFTHASVVPEPSALLLWAAGGALLAWRRRRR